MKLKRLIPLLAGLALLVTGCYKDDIIALQKQIDEMSAFDLDRQVKEIEATIKMLQDSDFQKGIDAVSTALSEKETALQNQINDLKSQVSTAASSTKVEELEAQIVGLTSQLAQVQSSIKVLEGVDLPQTVADLKTLIEKASGYDTEIATLKNQFAGLDLDKKLADIKVAYETAIATSKEEMESYFNSNFQKKFEELFGKTQETIEHWITNSESFQDLISEFADLQDEVSSQISVLGLRGKEIDSLKNMASAVEYDIKKAIENAINTLQVGDIKALKDSTESLKNAVSTLRSDVDALQELPDKIGDFTKLQTTLIDAIIALQGDVEKVEDYGTIKDLVLALKANLTDASDKLVDIKDIIKLINDSNEQISVNRDSIGINATAIAALAEKVGTLPSTDVTDALAADILKIQGGEIGEYNLADIVTDITKITTALSDDSSNLIAVKDIVAKLNALLAQVGESTDGADKNTIYGLIAGLDAKLGLIGNKTLKEYVDSTSGANKKALADSLEKVNAKLSDLDSRIAAIETTQLTSLENRVKALEDIVGKGELKTSATTLIGAINDLVDFLGYQKDKQAEKSISELIIALQADLSAIESGLDPTSTNLLTLKTQADALEELLEGFGEIDFGSKKGVQALNELINAVGSIQTTFANYVTTEFLTDTLDVYFTKKEANGLKQTLEEFKSIIGDGTNPDGTTILSRIAVLEAAAVTLTGESSSRTFADAINYVFGELNSHVADYQTTLGVITEIQSNITTIEGNITAINNLLGGDADDLDSFEVATVIGALNELKVGLESTTVDITDAVDSLASKRTVNELKNDVTAAHQALINAMLGYTDKNGTAAEAGALVQQLKTTLDELKKDLWKFNIGGTGEYTIQEAIDELNSRISAVNALVGEGFKDEEGKTVDLTTYIKGLETTLDNLSSGTTAALDSVKNNIRNELAAAQAAIINAVLGVEGSLDDFEELNLSSLADRVKDLEDTYVTQDKLTEELNKISGSLGGLYTNAQIDSMVNAIINAFYLEETAAENRLAALGSINTMIQGFKTDIVTALTALDKIGTKDYDGETLTDAIAALQATMSTLGDKVGDSSKGLVKDVADINTKLEELKDIPTSVEALETKVNSINTTLGKVLTKTQVDSAILVLAKALYVGTAVEDTSYAEVRTMMEAFKAAVDKIGNGFEGTTLTDKINDLSTDLSSLKDVVGQAKDGETAATGLFKYVDDAIAEIANEAIQSAIDAALEGVYDQDEIDEMVGDLQGAIAELKDILDGKADTEGLLQQVATLREEMKSLTEIVQSIVYVPQFEDGMIYVDGVYNEDHPQKYDNPHNNVELDFRINTYKGYKFNPENYTFTGYITSTKIPTKAYAKGGEGFKMEVLSYGGESGEYKHILALRFNSKQIADDDPFWSGNAGASIAVEIMETNGNSLTTEYIPLKLNRTTEVPSDPGDDPEEPQGVKFVVSPTEQTVGNAGGQIEVKVTSAHYWILEGITDDPGIFYFGSAYGGISATIGGSQYSRPFFTGTQIVYFNIPAYTNSRATANGKEPGKELEYTFTFKEYDSNSLDRFNNPNGNNTGTATLTIRQTPRKTQEFETDPAECKNGITVEWNEADTTFFVMPSDQKSDFILNPSPVDWVTFDRDDTGEAGVAEITLNFTERPKTKEGFYGERETTLTLTAATGENTYITIKQLPHPAADFKFYEGESGDTEVDATTAHTFAYGDYDDVNPFTFRVVPGDGLSDWTYDGDSSFDEKFDVSVSSKDGDGIATVTVSPKAYNADYDNGVTGSITFTLADGETTETLNFVQSKRVASALNVAPDEISFTWDGKKTGETSKDTVHVSVTAEDGFNDWVVKSRPSWVEEITNNGDGIAVIKLNADNNDAEPRTEAVTFCIKSGDATYDQGLNITQTARPEEEKPTLAISSEDSDFDNGKSFNWNAFDSDESVTFTATSGFSGDVDHADKSEGFDEWFTVTPEPTPRTKAAPKASTYTVTPKKVNNDWENDVEKTLTFVSVDKNGVESEETTVLTFKITKRGGDGSAPTITLNPEVRDTTFTCKGYVKNTSNDVYEFTVAPGTFKDDSWTYDKDETFSTYFELDSTDNASSRTYKVSVVKTPLDDAEHIGKLTFTPTAGEESGDPVVMTFKKEAYTQTLTFKVDDQQISSGADLSLAWKKADNNKITISVTADNADANHQYTAAITNGDSYFSITPESSSSESATTFTITPNSSNEDEADRTGVVTFTSAIGGKTYTFNLKQDNKLKLNFKEKTEFVGSFSNTDPKQLSFDYIESTISYASWNSQNANGWTNIIALEVDPGTDTREWSAAIDGSGFGFYFDSINRTGSFPSFTPPSSISITPANNSGKHTLYVHPTAANSGNTAKTATLKFTTETGDLLYEFPLSQKAKVQISSIAIEQNGEEVTTYDLPLKVTSGSNRVAGTVTFTATAEPDGYESTINWKSSDTNVATVDATGKVTAKKVGQVTITAYSSDNENVKATCTVNVLQTYKRLTSGSPTSGNVILIAAASNSNNKTPILKHSSNIIGVNSDYLESNGYIAGNYSDCEFTYFTQSSSQYLRYAGTGSTYCYLRISSNTLSISANKSDTSSSYRWKQVTSQYLQDNSNSRYVYYDSGTFTTSTSSNSKIRIYVKE